MIYSESVILVISSSGYIYIHDRKAYLDDIKTVRPTWQYTSTDLEWSDKSPLIVVVRKVRGLCGLVRRRAGRV